MLGGFFQLDIWSGESGEKAEPLPLVGKTEKIVRKSLCSSKDLKSATDLTLQNSGVTALTLGAGDHRERVKEGQKPHCGESGIG